jgi:uncharacterized membrane protein
MNLNELYNENKNPFQDVVDKVAAKEKQADVEHTKGLKDIADKFQSAEKKSSEEFSKKLRPSVSEEEEKTTKTKCPPATQDITLNLENRQKAIDEYGYGPLNPAMPNNKFWMKKVDEWNLDSAEEAKKSLCGNCAAFDVRRDTLDCIATGIDAGNPADAEGVIDAGDLGYCKFLKFKCASRRTCDAWVGGGPLTDKQGVAEGSVTKKPQPYNDPNWVKNLPKEKLDPIAGPKYKKDKKEQGVAEATEYGIPDSTPGQLPGGAKMTFGEFKKMWPGVILKRPSGGSLAGSVVADVEGWMNNPKSVWEPLEGVAESQFDPINDDDFYEYNVNTNKIVKRISGKHPIARQFSPMQKEWAGRDADHKIVRGMYAKQLKPKVDEKVSDFLPKKLGTGHDAGKSVRGWRKTRGLDEKAPEILSKAVGAVSGAVSGIGGALIGNMFAPLIGSIAGGAAGAIGGYKVGSAITDAIWDDIAKLFGGEKKAIAAGVAHAKAAAAGEKSFEFNGKKYPVTLKPQEVGKAVAELKAVKEAYTMEKAPPGAKAERMVKHVKKNYSKDGKLTPTEKSIAYATAWKAHNAGKV